MLFERSDEGSSVLSRNLLSKPLDASSQSVTNLTEPHFMKATRSAAVSPIKAHQERSWAAKPRPFENLEFFKG
jgi:hypothetical protein